jgi:hypothetical protein
MRNDWPGADANIATKPSVTAFDCARRNSQVRIVRTNARAVRGVGSLRRCRVAVSRPVATAACFAG